MTPNTNTSEFETSVARNDARPFRVIEKLPFRNPVLESDRYKPQVYTKSAEAAINGCTRWVSGQNSPEETGVIDVALYALAVLNRASATPGKSK
jgi:hypothetical protein